MAPSDSNGKSKGGMKDEFELEFDVGAEREDGRVLKLREKKKSSSQVAFETNSSLGSENCSIDSI